MKGWWGGAEAGMGVRELVKNCIGSLGSVGAQSSTAHLKKRSSFQSV